MEKGNRKGMKEVKCMNHDPENSKWGEYAPEDGACKELIMIDEKSDRGLCYRCTSRSVSNLKFKSE
jgi:hypothetical protein|tara:strand:- start:473 stop:670 length:198 start_codon:yes stop_codon:yes gene_type:complete